MQEGHRPREGSELHREIMQDEIINYWVIVPVRGVSCIITKRMGVRAGKKVIVPVRGVSCIQRMRFPAGRPRCHRPREGSELHPSG